MARYTGPKTKKARAFGEAIYGDDKFFQRRPTPPGQHGNSRKKKAASGYGEQLKEKQKAKYTYGLLERQFRKTFAEAHRRQGPTGAWLLQLLEARLDNTVFRMGISKTRNAARQLVGHRHVTVNGKVVNIPSYSLKPGDVVSVRGKSQGLELVTDQVASSRRDSRRFAWVEWNPERMQGTFLAYPERESIPENINDKLIVELYSK